MKEYGLESLTFRRPAYYLWYNIFYKWQKIYTREISKICLPKHKRYKENIIAYANLNGRNP